MPNFRRLPDKVDDGAEVTGVEVEVPAIASGADPRRPAAPAQLGWLIFWMSGVLTAFIVAALSVRALQHSLNAFEMMTVRSFGGLVILLAMGLASPALLRSVSLRHMRMQVPRNIVIPRAGPLR